MTAQVGEAEKELAGAGGSNPYAQLVDEAEGLDKIEELQNHSNEDIYDKAVNILETFFDVEDGEVENLAPQVDANQVRLRLGLGKLALRNMSFTLPIHSCMAHPVKIRSTKQLSKSKAGCLV